MYICVCSVFGFLCVWVYILYICVYMCIHECLVLCLCVCACGYMCMHVCLVCICVCMCIYMWTCMFSLVFVCMCVYMWTCMFSFVFVCVYMCVCIYVSVCMCELTTLVSPIFTLYLTVWVRDSRWAHWLSGPAAQWAPGVLLPQPSQSWGYRPTPLHLVFNMGAGNPHSCPAKHSANGAISLAPKLDFYLDCYLVNSQAISELF